MVEITDKQKELIEWMNEFCMEKFDFTGKTRQEASAYISRNIEEYKLLTMDEWQIKYS